MKFKRKKVFKNAIARFRNSQLHIAVGILVVFGALGGASYGTYRYVTTNNSQADHNSKVVAKVDAKTDSLKEGIAKIDTKKDTIATPKKASETKIDYSDPRAPTLETGAGCAGIACYTQGGFSLTASPMTVYMNASETNVPVTIKTTDGSKVDWGGMPDDHHSGYDAGVSSFAYKNIDYSSSFTYYIEAKARASGTYRLTFYATREKPSRQTNKITVTVKVTAAPYYTVTVGTGSLVTGHVSFLYVPFTIHRYNGHADAVSLGGKVTCPGNTATNIGTEVLGGQSQATANVQLIPFTLPNSCTIQISAWDASGRYFSDSVSFKVQ